MRIDAITTCVGSLYAGYLAKALPSWLESLDSVTIATNEPALATWLAAFHPVSISRKLTYRITDAFTRNGASFNKAAALNEAFTASQTNDWVLSIDCDITLHQGWRAAVEPMLQVGKLHGAPRYQHGQQCDRRFYPRGYFQLWHSSDTNAAPFKSNRHAGGYDTEFAKRWRKEEWVQLPITVEHLGTKSMHWFGPGTTREQMRGAQRGAAKSRLRTA